MLSIVSERREKTWQHLESKIPDDFAASIDKPCVNTDKNTVAEEQVKPELEESMPVKNQKKVRIMLSKTIQLSHRSLLSFQYSSITPQMLRLLQML